MNSLDSAWQAIRRIVAPRHDSERLGAFVGVFTPSILTILGVIMFLRTGWVVGNVGLVPALGIVLLAHAVTLITGLSVSAVATNMRVRTGGAYFIISRSLGIEVGTAIGMPLFLALAFSVTLYAFGLAESLQFVWEDAPLRPVAAVTVLAAALLAAKGAGVALRLQLPIMVAIGLALVSVVIGVVRADGVAPDVVALEDSAEFWTVFAVFFPAVTGIMAGISMSGDLRDPRKAIPRGTIAAVLTGLVVYLAVPVLLAVSVTPEELVTNNLVWFDLAGPLAFFILMGLWGAIFSSAVGSILGAPRTLEAMVDDRVVPPIWGRDLPRVEGPGVPLLVTTVLAIGAVMLGDLDAVAPLLTMFFLTTYGTINLVAGLEQLSADPSYRPMLRVPWWVSMLGAAACFVVMFLINPVALVAALIFEVGLYAFMRRRGMVAPWGDLRRGALTSLVRSSVLQLRTLPDDPRNWRPNVLVFAGDVRRRNDLVRIAGWLEQDRGILTVADLLVGSLEDYAGAIPDRTRAMQRELDDLGIVGFPEVDVVARFEPGALAVAQSNGIAGISSNTVMFGWSRKPERRAAQVRLTRELALIGKSTVVCRVGSGAWRTRNRHIHVWWGGLQQNGDMLVLFAHLLSENPAWRNARITINSVASNEMMRDRNRGLLDRLTQAARIDATSDVLIKPEDADVQDIMWERSGDADIVLLGMRQVEAGGEEAYADRMANLSSRLPTTLFVHNASNFRGQLLGDADEVSTLDGEEPTTLPAKTT